MVDRRGIEEFRNTGLLLIINQLLHIFGWAIVISYNERGIPKMYPARVKFRGFSNEVVADAYLKVTEYMRDNSENLLKEVKDEA